MDARACSGTRRRRRPHDPAQQSLFDAVTLIARLRGSRAKPGEREGRTGRTASRSTTRRGPIDSTRRQLGSLPRSADGTVARIDHVGSTSVPGLAAKPIVDIQLSLVSMVPRSAYVEPLVALGYRLGRSTRGTTSTNTSAARTATSQGSTSTPARPAAIGSGATSPSATCSVPIRTPPPHTKRSSAGWPPTTRKTSWPTRTARPGSCVRSRPGTWD